MTSSPDTGSGHVDVAFLRSIQSLSVAIAPIFGFFGRVATNVWYSIILLVAVVVYICLGAFAFQKLETGEKFMNLTAERMERVEMLKYFTIDEGHNGTALTEEDWDYILQLSKGRCFKADAKDARENIWNFWSSMDFCSTILTTIGYGGMVPHTGIGKFIVVVYASFGLLLMMSYLNLFSVLILLVIKKILKLTESLANLVRVCLRNLQRKSEGPGTPIRLSKFAISIVLAVTSLLMLIAYLVFMSWLLADSSPNDNFLKALYFYVITMTTVGLGDIAVIDYQWYGVVIKVLFVFCVGLALVTTVFGAMRNLAEENRKRVVKATRLLAEKAKNQKKKLVNSRSKHNGDSTSHNTALVQEDV